MIVGHTLLIDFAALWTFATDAAPLLGDAVTLIAMGEHATAVAIAPWPSFPHEDWRQGRLFGHRGELRWRMYGSQLRAVLLLDDTATDHTALYERMTAFGLQAIHRATYSTREESIYLWPNGAYSSTTIRYYRDDHGAEPFFRYLDATPTIMATSEGAFYGP
jgi:hypothetical protein